MTKNPIKKIAISLVNNSFTENLIPFLKVYNRLPVNQEAIRSRFAIQSQSTIGKARVVNTDFYGTSFSQKIKKAESDIIKQYFRQLEASFPRFSNSRLQLLAEGGFDGPSEKSLALLAKQSFTKSLWSKSKIEKKIPFTVLLSVEHIRNAILSRRSVSVVRQTDNTKLTRQTRFQSFSDFKKQIYECRKIRLLYGNLSRKDFNKSAVKAKSIHGVMGENLLLILETRLDVTLYRCGFFPTIKAAKQSVIHKRIQINNAIVNTPSYQMKAGDIIKVISSNVSINFLEGCVRFKTFFQDKRRHATQKKKDDLYPNSTKNRVAAQWINDTVNERSLQWRYATSADMIRCLLHLQYNILLPFLRNWHKDFHSKKFFFAKTFVNNYYKNRLNFTLKQNTSFSYKLSSEHLGDKEPPTSKVFASGRLPFGEQSLSKAEEAQAKGDSYNQRTQSYFTKDKADNGFWTRSLIKSVNLALSCLSSQKAINSALQKPLNNFSKAWLGSYIGSTLDTVFKTLSSIVCIVTNRQTLLTKYIKNQAKRRANNSDYRDHLFFHLFCYSLLVQKKLISLSNRVLNLEPVYDKNLHYGNKNKVVPYQSSIEYQKHKKQSKVLHLEISYASLCAIYLYAPQRIYLPAAINLDLLKKIFY